MELVKYTYSVSRKRFTDEFQLYQNAITFDITEDLGDSYVCTNEMSNGTWVVYKDSEARMENCLQKLSIEELSSHRMCFSFWIMKGENKQPYINSAKAQFNKYLITKRKEADTALKAIELL